MQCLDGLIEQVGVGSHRSKLKAKMLCPLRDHLFGNGIRCQKRTQSEEVGGGGILLLHLREGEGPGGRDWQGVIIHQLPTTLSEQIGTTVLVEALVLREATSGLFDIGSCLIQGQRQSAHFFTDGTCYASIVFRSLLKGCLNRKQAGTAQQEECGQLG